MRVLHTPRVVLERLPVLPISRTPPSLQKLEYHPRNHWKVLNMNWCHQHRTDWDNPWHWKVQYSSLCLNQTYTRRCRLHDRAKSVYAIWYLRVSPLFIGITAVAIRATATTATAAWIIRAATFIVVVVISWLLDIISGRTRCSTDCQRWIFYMLAFNLVFSFFWTPTHQTMSDCLAYRGNISGSNGKTCTAKRERQGAKLDTLVEFALCMQHTCCSLILSHTERFGNVLPSEHNINLPVEFIILTCRTMNVFI